MTNKELISITIHKGDKVFHQEVAQGSNLWQTLIESGFLIESGCGGRGRCSSCRVLVVKDGVTHEILACRQSVGKTVVLEIPDITSHSKWTLIGEVGAGELALGIDAGTTTVGMYLADMSGDIVAKTGFSNPQVTRGADVMSRLTAADDPEVRLLLANVFRDAIVRQIESLKAYSKIEADRITRTVIVGNGAMVLLVTGMDGAKLGLSPYENPLAGVTPVKLDGSEWGLTVGSELVLLPPCQGFLGSDSVAGAWAAGLCDENKPRAFIDIGTNGEVLLWNGEKLWGTSVAAGPALEGAHLSCGMSATTGAIYRIVQSVNGSVEAKSLGDGPPKGMCGTGALSALSYLKRAGGLELNGRLVDGFEGIGHDSDEKKWKVPTGKSSGEDIYVTQKDVREIQLAKSALRTGLEKLSKIAGISSTDLQEVIITGAFGVNIDATDLWELGVIPRGTPVRQMENGAGMGAVKAALSNDSLQEVQKFIEQVNYVNLAEEEDFQDMFLSYLSLFNEV